ncbi:MAG: cupin domain-containing protein [Acidobacteriaceae bacterium]|nr:cupin domain-containing protein [Acidobacteriaceae bacterium]
MNLTRALIIVMVACPGLFGTAWCQTNPPNPKSQNKDRARTLISQALPPLDGHGLKAILVEVRYGPGEASPPHSHPCAVIGYVAAGSLRTKVQGEPEMIYNAGQNFYEAPNGVHLVSANASTTEPAKLLAYFICDRDTPLSIDIPENRGPEGESR